MTKEKIKEDLKDIRYYYHCRKKLGGVETAFQKAIKGKVKAYTDLMYEAPVKLYDLYIELYVENGTQVEVAENLGYSLSYVKKLNRQLCEFLLTELNEKK